MIRALDDFRRAIAVVDGAIDGVVEDRDDVRRGLGRGFLSRIVDAGLHEDIEGGSEPRLLNPQLGHPFVFRGAHRRHMLARQRIKRQRQNGIHRQ